MAKLKGVLQMTGSIGGMTIYKMRGCNELIVRTKGGATKEQIMTNDCFKNVRKQNKEWSGVGQMAGAIRRAMKPLANLADYNFSGQLTALAKTIQKLDETNESGQRSINLSQYKELLSGFRINEKHTFHNTVSVPVTFVIDRNQQEATVTIQSLNPLWQLKNFTSFSNFRFVVTLGLVADVAYDATDDQYTPVDETLPEITSVLCTEWFQTDQNLTKQVLTLPAPALPQPIDDRISLILGIGIEFAPLRVTGKPISNKFSGCAQILGVG